MIEVENLTIAKVFSKDNVSGFATMGRSSFMTAVSVARNVNRNHGNQQIANKTAIVANMTRHFLSFVMQRVFLRLAFDVTALRNPFLLLLLEMALNMITWAYTMNM